MSLLTEARALAEGKIKCACGNEAWRSFIYISPGAKDTLLAGCKRCGAILGHKPDTGWTQIAAKA